MDADEEEAVEPNDVVVSRLWALAEAASGKRSGLASCSAFSRSRSTLSIEYGLSRNVEEFEVFSKKQMKLCGRKADS